MNTDRLPQVGKRFKRKLAESDTMLTVAGAAEYAGVYAESITDWVKRVHPEVVGSRQFFRYGTHTYITFELFDRYMDLWGVPRSPYVPPGHTLVSTLQGEFTRSWLYSEVRKSDYGTIVWNKGMYVSPAGLELLRHRYRRIDKPGVGWKSVAEIGKMTGHKRYSVHYFIKKIKARTRTFPLSGVRGMYVHPDDVPLVIDQLGGRSDKSPATNQVTAC